MEGIGAQPAEDGVRCVFADERCGKRISRLSFRVEPHPDIVLLTPFIEPIDIRWEKTRYSTELRLIIGNGRTSSFLGRIEVNS